MSKSGLLVLLLAVCAFYTASAKPATNTLSLPSEPNRDPDRPVTLPGPAPCENGKSWKMGCNTCSCYNGQAACTLMLCLDHPVSKRAANDAPTCKEGAHWKQDCNTCVCRNGLQTCTRMHCVPPQE